MSKIGDKPVEVPVAVNVTIEKSTVIVKGKEGELRITLPKILEIIREGNLLKIICKSQEKKAMSQHGLFRQLVFNAITGVNTPWEKKLEIVGTGYNCKMQGEDLVLKLGFSHPVIFKKIAGVKFQVDENNKITVFGADKQLVGQVAYLIKLSKKPDSYKGKGVRYQGEKIKLKPSKKVKATGVTAAA